MLVFGCFHAAGDTLRSEYTIRFKISKSDVDMSYGDNAGIISSIASTIDSINRTPGLRLKHIMFTGSSSPDGPLQLNRRLSDERFRAAVNCVRSRTAFPDSVISLEQRVTDWESLRSMIVSSDMPGKEDAIAAIDNLPEFSTDSKGRETTPRKDRLMELHGGSAWQHMLRNFFPALRKTAVVISSSCATANASAKVAETACETEEAIGEIKGTAIEDPLSRPFSQETVQTAPERRSFYMSLSTNMLYDALLVPNIGAEFYLGSRWSIAADWMYGWWSTSRRHRYWRVYGGEIALRHWFGGAAERKPLTGHHAGIYTQAITYDFEFGGKGQMAGKPGGSLWDKCSYGVGLEYGYSMPVAPRLNIDFTIGVGYFGGTYYEYRPIDGKYVWQSTHRRHWFGPTRAMVSLVWLLGHGNTNAKGGKK